MPNAIGTAEGAKDVIKGAIRDILSEAVNQRGRPYAKLYFLPQDSSTDVQQISFSRLYHPYPDSNDVETFSQTDMVFILDTCYSAAAVRSFRSSENRAVEVVSVV